MFSLSLSLSLSLSPFYLLPLIIIIKYRTVWPETDSSYTSEEAVQNPQHHHGEWAISGSNLGSE
jgi:hypothetical protein